MDHDDTAGGSDVLETRAVGGAGSPLDSQPDGLTAAMELVLTPALFAVFGYFLDRWLGTAPVLMIVLGLLVLTYEVWKLTYVYNLRMKKHEADRQARLREARRRD